MAHSLLFCCIRRTFHGRDGVLDAVSCPVPCQSLHTNVSQSYRTSAGLYYFSAKLAPPKYAPLASWITGWANVTGQVTLVCGIDFTCAQMITTAIAVATDGAVIVSSGATFGILLAILFSHAIVCSAATSILARLNLFYVLINGKFSYQIYLCKLKKLIFQWAPLSLLSSLFLFFPTVNGHQRQMLLPSLKTIQVGATVSLKIWLFFFLQLLTLSRWLGFHAGLYCSDVDPDRL